MPMRVFVVADNRGQFNDWCCVNRINPAACEFVRADQMKDLQMHDGDKLIVAHLMPVVDSRQVA